MQMELLLVMVSLAIVFTLLMMINDWILVSDEKKKRKNQNQNQQLSISDESQAGTPSKASALFMVFAMIFWFISASGVVVIHEPYNVVYENNGEHIVEEGVRQVTSNWPLAYLFLGMAFLCLAFFVLSNWEWLLEKLTMGRRKGNF